MPIHIFRKSRKLFIMVLYCITFKCDVYDYMITAKTKVYNKYLNEVVKCQSIMHNILPQRVNLRRVEIAFVSYIYLDVTMTGF